MNLVLCEGYRDRSFLSGLLGRFGWRARGRAGRPAADDSWGKVPPGVFSFERDGHFLRLVGCGGHTGVRKWAEDSLAERTTHAVGRVMVNLDGDAFEGDWRAAFADYLRSLARRHDAAALQDSGDWLLDDGAVRLVGVAWHWDGLAVEGVARTQCLDRLVTGTLATVYPERAGLVGQWLGASGAGSVKASTWMWMAGWQAEEECDRFFRAMWEDVAVAAELERLLIADGTWGAIARL